MTVFIVGATVTVHQFFCILHFCHTYSLCRVQYSSPRGVRLKCYYAFFLVCCGCDTSYIVSVHIQYKASVYTLSLCRGHSWRVRLAKQETLTLPGHLVSFSGLQESANVHRGALLLVPQWQCISVFYISFVFYIIVYIGNSLLLFSTGTYKCVYQDSYISLLFPQSYT